MDVNIGKGLTIPVDADKLPENSMVYALEMGLHNILMDCHAGITKEGAREALGADVEESTVVQWVRDKSLAKAKEKLEALMRGEIRVVNGRGPKRSELEIVLDSILEPRMVAFAKSQDIRKKDVDPKDWKAAKAMMLDADPSIIAEAKNILASRAKTPVLDLSTIKLVKKS